MSALSLGLAGAWIAASSFYSPYFTVASQEAPHHDVQRTLRPVPFSIDYDPYAVRKMPTDPNEKFYPEYAAFDPAARKREAIDQALAHRETMASFQLARSPLPAANSTTDDDPSSRFHPPFNPHPALAQPGNSDWALFRRAAEALAILEKRQTCPSGMRNCESVGNPAKCCMPYENCVKVDNDDVGGIACCPHGSNCVGAVGVCPSEAVECSAEVGGGCCIAGYVCKGLGCVPENSKNQDDNDNAKTTKTSTTTTTTTTTSKSTVTNAAPPFRPTPTSTSNKNGDDDDDNDNDDDDDTATYCPTGYYACLARHGGGCCQTGRSCAERVCPPLPTPMVTIVMGDRTIAVPKTDLDAAPTSTQTAPNCASGWSLCGDEGGPNPGCCPDSFQCGLFSCTQTTGGLPGPTAAVVQKKLVGESAAAGWHRQWKHGLLAMVCALALV